MSPPDEQTCRNCGAGHGPDDIFCESCGYDFITGSLPSPDEARALGLTAPGPPGPAPAAPPPMAPAPMAPPPMAPSPGPAAAPGAPPPPGGALVRFEISVDRAYFDTVVSEGELDFPDPVPGPRVIEKVGPELHIGRTSQSRAIHPDLDIAQLTGDPAVSSRHAVVRVSDSGELSVSDVGSTNGTIVGSPDSPAITRDEIRPIASGDSVYLGAWTRLLVSLVAPA